MARRGLLCIPLFVALLAYLLPAVSLFRQQPREYVHGRNGTVLFITNIEHGLSNAHIATAQSLLEHHQDIDVHYAFFATGPVESKLKRMAAFVRRRGPRAKNVEFHPLAGKTFEVAGGYDHDNVSQNMVSPPGISGLPQLMTIIDSIHGWTVEEHLEIYTEVVKLIEEVDPAVVILDTMMAPAVDATRAANRAHIIITPNTLAENFAPLQPYGRGFWKYPALGTGFSYPLPWRNIPENLYVNFRIIVQFLWSNRMNELRQAGIKDPSNLINMHREDVPWITMNTEGAALPVQFVPANVTGVGPMVLSSAPALEQDSELVAWASRADTILINLGSFFKYTRDWAVPMVDAVADLLGQTEGKVQVLWKFNTRGDVPSDLMDSLQPHINSGRLRLSKWLTVDPMSLLESGSIAVSVHHGGSNCYHEAVRAGVPHIILPLWADLYAFASLVENIGIGVWACKETAPRWTSQGLLDAMLSTLDDKNGVEIRRKAKELGEEVRSRPSGRDAAAKEVAKLAFIP